MKTLFVLLGLLSLAPSPASAEEESPLYRATGKILMEGAGDLRLSENLLGQFHATQIEVLKGREIMYRARERVRGLHPELKEAAAEVDASVMNKTHIVRVEVKAPDQIYAKVYLDAVLDEYMAFRQEMLEKSVGTAANKIIEEVLTREKKVKEKETALADFMRSHPDNYDAGANKAQYAILTGERDNEKENYKSWRKALENIEATLKQASPRVAITERAGAAEKIR